MQASPHSQLMSRSLAVDVQHAAGDQYEPEPEPEFTMPGPSPTGLYVPMSLQPAVQSPGTQKAVAGSMFEPMISPSKEHLGLSLNRAKKQAKLSYRTLRATDIRAKKDPNSLVVGKLERGQVFEVLQESKWMEQVFVELHVGGSSAKGWVAMTSGKGKPLCVTEAAVQHLLSTVPLLQELEEHERKRVAEFLDGDNFKESESIIQFGETGERCNYMYFVEYGAAEAEVMGEVVRVYGRGDFFGELALLTDEPRSATVKAVGKEGCRCLKLSRTSFNEFASKCTAILDQRRKQYANVHVIDISEPALESYLARPDLRDNMPDSSYPAPQPSKQAMNLLRRIIAHAPARVPTTMGYQRIDRRLTENGHAQDLVEYDIHMISKNWETAMNRVQTTYLSPQARMEKQDKEDEEEARLIAKQMDSGGTNKLVGGCRAPNSKGNTVSFVKKPGDAPSTPTKQQSAGIGTPGTRPAMGTPSQNTKSVLQGAVPSVDRNAPMDEHGVQQHQLNKSARSHIRNFLAIARDLQAMMYKYGFDEADVLAPFGDPTLVFGRRVGGYGVPFVSESQPGKRGPQRDTWSVHTFPFVSSIVASTKFGQPEVDRLLVVTRARLRPTVSAQKYEDGVTPPGMLWPLTEMDGHIMAAVCEIDRSKSILLKHDGQRAARLTETLLDGLLVDPDHPRRKDQITDFEAVKATVQRDFAYCFKMLAPVGRHLLTEDERVVEYLCEVAATGWCEGAKQYAKEAVIALQPDIEGLKSVVDTGLWKVKTAKVGTPEAGGPKTNISTISDTVKAASRPHAHPWSTDARDFAGHLLSLREPELRALAAAEIPEGDPATSPSIASPRSPSVASPVKPLSGERPRTDDVSQELILKYFSDRFQ